MKSLRIAAVFVAALAMAACSSQAATTTGRVSASAPSVSVTASRAPSTTGVVHTSAVRAAFPVGAPVTSGPIGGSWCTTAWWAPSSDGITVQINAAGPDSVSVQVVDGGDTPIGTGSGQIDADKSGVQVHVSGVNAGRVAAVSVSVAGAELGTCAAPEHGKSAAPASSATHTVTRVSASTAAVRAKAPDVKAQLLPLTAMPAGWSVNPDTSSSSTSSALGKCKSNPKTGAAASASYVGGTSGIPEFNETIAYRPGTAAKDMAAFAKTLDGCKTFTADSGGTKITGTIERMNVPKIGAATDAWQIALTASGLTFGMDVVAFRTATEDVSVQYAGFGSPDVNTVVGLCRKAFARL